MGLYLLPLFPLGFQSFGPDCGWMGFVIFLQTAGHCIQIIIGALDDIFTVVYLVFFWQAGSLGSNYNDSIKDGENFQPGFRLSEG